MKASFTSLASALDGKFSKLNNVSSPTSTLSAEEMIETIQVAVKAAVPNVASSSGMSDELKALITSNLKEFASASRAVSGDSEEKKEQLQSVARMLLEVKDDIKKVSSEIADVRADLAEVNIKLGAHTSMLSALISGKHNAPSLVVVFPAKPPSKRKGGGFFTKVKGLKGKALGMFANEMIVMFICPVTKKPAKSGKDGKGYHLVLAKDWVKKVAPVLSISMRVLQIALKTYGIPLPTISLPYEMSSLDFIRGILEEIECDLADGIDEAVGDEKAVMEEYQEAYESAKEAIELCDGSSTLTKKKQEKLVLALKQADAGVSYEAIRNLLAKVEKGGEEVGADWEPKFTGLRKVVSDKDGTVAWISKEGEALFHKIGVDSLQ
jgi:hypothetical protein